MPVLLVLLLLFGVPAGLVVLALEDEPAATAPVAAGPDDVGRLRDLARENDPRRFRSGEPRTVVVSERDLNLALAHALRRTAFLAARLGLDAGAADVALTLRMPENPLGRYLNVTGRLAADGGGLAVERASIGRIPVPAALADPLARLAHRALLFSDDYRAVSDAVRSIDLDPETMRVSLVWDETMSGRLRSSGSVLLAPADQERLGVWAANVDETLSRFPGPVSLARVLPPLFAEARRRPGDPAAENRALLLALGLQAAGPRATRAARAGGFPAPGSRTRLTLHGRFDLGRHFLVSAAAAVAADSALAGAAGLFKEIEDSRGGSGFSFADLAADRAGVRLAEAAAAPETARLVQERLTGTVAEEDFMPPIDGLEEGLDEGVFRDRYGSPDDPRTRSVVAGIDRRIESRPLYR